LPLLLLLSFPKGICCCLCRCLCFFGCHSRRESAVKITCHPERSPPGTAEGPAVAVASLVVIPEGNLLLPLPLSLPLPLLFGCHSRRESAVKITCHPERSPQGTAEGPAVAVASLVVIPEGNLLLPLPLSLPLPLLFGCHSRRESAFCAIILRSPAAQGVHHTRPQNKIPKTLPIISAHSGTMKETLKSNLAEHSPCAHEKWTKNVPNAHQNRHKNAHSVSRNHIIIILLQAKLLCIPHPYPLSCPSPVR
jgi:hypothetical protein